MTKLQRADRVVGFQLDTLVGSGPSFNEISGAELSFNTLQQLGSTCLVLANVPARVAESRLQKCGLKANHVVGELIDADDKSAILAKADVWAYVGSSAADMRAARKADVKAIGVSPDLSVRRQLWVSGADIVLNNLEELPNAVWFRPKRKTPDLSTMHSAQELGINKHNLEYWISVGAIPCVTDVLGQIRLPDSFIDMIRPFTKYGQPSIRQIELFHLQWKIDYGAFRERRDALEEVGALKARGELYGSQQVAKLIGYSRHTIGHWLRTGFLPGIKVGGDYLFSARDAERVKSIMDGYTTDEVANQLGLVRPTITRLVAEGKLTAQRTPNGFRFEPKEVVRYGQQRKTERDETWDAARVRQELGIQQSTLNQWCEFGLLGFQRASANADRQFDPASVQRLKTEISSWNDGFEWLGPSDSVATSATKQVARTFGVSVNRLAEWAEAGILPCYNRVPSALQRSDLHFPQDYIQALLAYAGGVPVPRRVAAEFSRLCKDAGKIVFLERPI